MMLAILAESALRSLLLGSAVWVGLNLLRVRNLHVHMICWVTVLAASLAMPLLIFGAGATDRAISGTSAAGALYFLASLCVFTSTLAPFAAAAALRIALD